MSLDGLTQARHRGEVEQMARSLIAISTDIPIEEITVRVGDPPA